MNADLAIVLALLAASIAMFVLNRPRMDAVGLVMIVALPLAGIISMAEALAGFSDPNVVLIAALFVIGEGLVRTGVARRIGDWLIGAAGSSETRLLVLLMATVGALGAVMSSTAVVAIFIPIALRIAQNSGLAPSQLMMPLSVAALISGMLTLVATAPNLVVNAELVRQGNEPFGFFSVTPFGLPVLALGVLYMLVARRLLPAKGGASGSRREQPSLVDWVDQYGLATREYRVRIAAGSPLTGARLETLDLRSLGADILAIERRRGFVTELIRPVARTELQFGDVLLVDLGTGELDIDGLRERFRLEPMPLSDAPYFTDRSQEIGMVEVLVPPESELIGSNIRDARIRDRFGLTVVGLRRGREVFGDTLLDEPLRLGDTLLLVGFWRDIRKMEVGSADLQLLNLPVEETEVLPAADRAPQALGCLALTVILMVSGLVPNVQAALIGCLLMGLFGCIDLSSAYRSISWKTIVLIAGMLPFSIALQRTGGVDLAAEGLIAVVGEASPRVVLASLFLITAALGLFISNTATAVLMAPVALAIAQDLGASPYPFAMIVMIAASTAFMTPVSSPVNTLVVSPGGYGFADFIRVGVPFSLVVMLLMVLLVPELLPP
jgi:di/tricarboxylate transporter